jgi:hypothetical protein
MRREQSAAIAVRQATTVQFNLTGNPTAPVSQDRQSHPYHREHVMENDQVRRRIIIIIIEAC